MDVVINDSVLQSTLKVSIIGKVYEQFTVEYSPDRIHQASTDLLQVRCDLCVGHLNHHIFHFRVSGRTQHTETRPAK